MCPLTFIGIITGSCSHLSVMRDSSDGGQHQLSSTQQHRPPTSRSSLADDINAIRQALEGASSVARERTLKILERLTARLALAESDRDMAVGELMSLQKRYRAMEGELQKKRAELRELLRQEATNGNGGAGSGESSSATPTPTAPTAAASAAATATNPDNGMSGSQRSSVTLEILTESAEISRAAATRSAGSSLSAGAEASNVAAESRLSSSLPKVDLKSPAKVIQEEKERGVSNTTSSDRSSSVRSSLSDKPLGSALTSTVPAAASPASAASAPSPVVVPASVALANHHRPVDFAAGHAPTEHHHLARLDLRTTADYSRLPQRHRSGTPTSTRSRVSISVNFCKLVLYYFNSKRSIY